ncbi:hypothetical protein PGT2_g00014 [Escherichia phage PGT2]|uniref:Uncharacterized protein n=1 Tax=Escherichia phage PGT2 TaxID=2047782 RepID=A0A2D2W2R6_9CAUD|nr:hypothetical protein HOS43_gp14 [Escherichia phage PGT2]ATS92432.1 hypothetical protein PGT2_g00014 [Escherichia phage PGT2]
MSERICVPYARKGNPDVHTIVIPAGFISLEDLLSHVGFQLGMGDQLLDEINGLLAQEYTAGKRALAEVLSRATHSATYTPNMEDAHRILTAEELGYANDRE